MASISVTLAPRSTMRMARLLPMNPRPPVIRTRACLNVAMERLLSRRDGWHEARGRCHTGRLVRLVAVPGIGVAHDILGRAGVIQEHAAQVFAHESDDQKLQSRKKGH